MSAISDLTRMGQSLWYDNIQRRLLENGEMAGMITRGEIRGVTSNPTIFNNAIAKSHDYDAALIPMAAAGLSAAEIFDRLAVEDIRHATDLFRRCIVTARAAMGSSASKSALPWPTIAPGRWRKRAGCGRWSTGPT